MTKKKVLIVDPPEGWKYGFPKPVPEFDLAIDFGEWLLEQGYPEELAEYAVHHSRFWEAEVDVDGEED